MTTEEVLRELRWASDHAFSFLAAQYAGGRILPIKTAEAYHRQMVAHDKAIALISAAAGKEE